MLHVLTCQHASQANQCDTGATQVATPPALRVSQDGRTCGASNRSRCALSFLPLRPRCCLTTRFMHGHQLAAHWPQAVAARQLQLSWGRPRSMTKLAKYAFAKVLTCATFIRMLPMNNTL